MHQNRKGSFHYIAKKIRAEAVGTEHGHGFERLCKFFLENDPVYQGRLKKVWLWNDWPERWGSEKGIDLIANTPPTQ